jgi:hemerythrin
MLQPDQIASDLAASEQRLIDDEHARLEQFLTDLRDTCENFGANGNCYGCTRTQVATCQGRLSSFFYDFLDLVAEHFENEEKIILGTLKAADKDAYFLQHQAEHSRLIEEVRKLMRASSLMSQRGNPSEAIRQLEGFIAEMFRVHAHAYDIPFLQMMQSRHHTN